MSSLNDECPKNCDKKSMEKRRRSRISGGAKLFSNALKSIHRVENRKCDENVNPCLHDQIKTKIDDSPKPIYDLKEPTPNISSCDVTEKPASYDSYSIRDINYASIRSNTGPYLNDSSAEIFPCSNPDEVTNLNNTINLCYNDNQKLKNVLTDKNINIDSHILSQTHQLSDGEVGIQSLTYNIPEYPLNEFENIDFDQENSMFYSLDIDSPSVYHQHCFLSESNRNCNDGFKKSITAFTETQHSASFSDVVGSSSALSESSISESNKYEAFSSPSSNSSDFFENSFCHSENAYYPTDTYTPIQNSPLPMHSIYHAVSDSTTGLDNHSVYLNQYSPMNKMFQPQVSYSGFIGDHAQDPVIIPAPNGNSQSIRKNSSMKKKQTMLLSEILDSQNSENNLHVDQAFNSKEVSEKVMKFINSKNCKLILRKIKDSQPSNDINKNIDSDLLQKNDLNPVDNISSEKNFFTLIDATCQNGYEFKNKSNFSDNKSGSEQLAYKPNTNYESSLPNQKNKANQVHVSNEELFNKIDDSTRLSMEPESGYFSAMQLSSDDDNNEENETNFEESLNMSQSQANTKGSNFLQVKKTNSNVRSAHREASSHYSTYKKYDHVPSYPLDELFDSDLPGFIDSHCHIDLILKRMNYFGTYNAFRKEYSDEFPPNYKGCIAVFCYPDTFDKTYLWQKHLNNDVWLSFGCHPKRADSYNDYIEDALNKALEHPQVRALGEIGLDYSNGNSCLVNVQQSVFRRQLQIAVQKNLSLVIHCRDAYEDCMHIMKLHVPKNHKIHMHCFKANWKWAQKWLTEFPNLCIGLTNCVTYPDARTIHEVATKIPLDRLLLETDAPYFVPDALSKNRRWTHSGLAIHVAAQVASLKRVPLREVLHRTLQNTKRIYNL